MSGFLNKATLIGNLGRDPEVRTTRDGKQVVTLSIATSESWNDQHSGERRQRTEWHRVVIWTEGLGKIAENQGQARHAEMAGSVRRRPLQHRDPPDPVQRQADLPRQPTGAGRRQRTQRLASEPAGHDRRWR